MSEAKQQKQEKINNFLPLIADYLKKYPNYENCISWNCVMLIEWEFYLLFDNGIIGKRGIKSLSGYAHFKQAKNKLTDQHRRRQFAKRMNTPPTPEF